MAIDVDEGLETQLKTAAEIMIADAVEAEAILKRVISSRPGPHYEGAKACYMLARLALIGARLHESLDWIDSAAEAYRDLGLEIDEARTRLGRINVLNDLGRHEEALAVGSSLIEFSANVAEKSDLITWISGAAFENTGVSLGRLGRHTEALAHYERASHQYELVGQPADKARMLGNRGVESIEVGDYDAALTLLTDAVVLFSDCEDWISAARCHNHIARVHAFSGSYGQAMGAMEAAEELLKVLESSQDRLRVDLVRAEVLLALNLHDETFTLAKTLIEQFQNAGMPRDAGLALLIQASAAAEKGSHGEAIEACQAAEIAFGECGVRWLEARAWLTRAEMMDNSSEAAELAHRAEKLFDATGLKAFATQAALRRAEIYSSAGAHDLALEIVSSDSLQSFTSFDWRVSYVKGMAAESRSELRSALGHYGSALQCLRKFRSSIPADSLRLAYMHRKRQVQEACVRVSLSLGDVNTAAAITESERSNSLVAHSRAGRVGEANDSVEANASVSDDHLPTVTYQSVGDELLAFLDSGSGPQLIKLPMSIPEIAHLSRNLRAQLGRCSEPRLAMHQRTLEAATRKLLQQLYLGIFEPIAANLSSDRVAIVPTGTVGNIPFHALNDGSSYMVNRFEISIAPSSKLVGGVSRREGNHSTMVIGAADAAAPLIRREAENIADITSGTILLNSAATREAVKAEIGSHDVIHIASHSKFRADNPWFSSLLLGDDWVTALDITSWDLNGALVVLASCNSGRQVGLGEGDEMLGLPRAFLAAGASAVIMNLWPAHDESSVGLMTSLHHNLGSMTPARALRESQIAALDGALHPYYWAPAVIYGSPLRETTILSDTRFFSHGEQK